MDKLQVFISWSGDRSRAVAKHLKTWLPDVVRNAEPWLSSEDLRKGLQWLPELNKNLSSTGFGLLVLTADNKDAPWLVFEAGVISKALPDKHCCPVLCDLKQSDISGPLTQFQSTTITSKTDMLQLVKTMNDASDASKIDDERLHKWFSRSWDEFAQDVDQALATPARRSRPAKVGPTERELLEEVLSTVRRLAIEPRKRRDDLLRGLAGPLVMSPELLLREFSKIEPELQERLFELVHQGAQTDPESLRQMLLMLRHSDGASRRRALRMEPELGPAAAEDIDAARALYERNFPGRDDPGFENPS